MRKISLPTDDLKPAIQKKVIDDSLVIGTTCGLVKNSNEDTVGSLVSTENTRICIADGHWGDGAAAMIRNFWMKTDLAFPNTRQSAIRATEDCERELFQKFGKQDMDADRDFTPEAAFVAVEYDHNILRMVSYGDCRLLVVRNQQLFYELETRATWLGAFSHLGLRQRLAVTDAVIYKEIPLAKDDLVLLFTDGVDECIYETPTISNERILELVGDNNSAELFDALMSEVFSYGAEDNAALVIMNVPPVPPK